MPIVHTCKACGCQVTEAEVARGQAMRKGKFTYCGECSALILDPVEMAAPAAPAAPAAAARPARQAPSAHQGLPSPDESPTGRQNALARNGIEVVEEFEIMSGNADVPDLDAALEGDDVGHDDQADIDTNPGAEPLDEAPAPARPSARAARAGRSARGDRGAGGSGSRRGVGGRGTNLGRRQQARASARGAGGAGGSSARRAAAPAAPAAKPESRRGAKEVFYKSGAKAAAINAVDVADQGGNAVESNVLDAVRANQARKAAGASSGGTRRSQRASARGGRASSRTSGRGGEEGGRGSVRGRAPTGGNNQTIIIGSIAGVIVLIGLVLMLSSGSTKGGNRSSGSEGHVSAGTYASQAKEKERAGDRIAAYELYLKAAESAEAAGRDEEARSYSMRAYAMQKHSTLQMGK